MSKITFDAIHTKTKQAKLIEMMHLAAKQCHQIANRNEKSVVCSVCQSQHIEFYVEKFGFTLDRCLDCGQIFCNPMPNRSQLESYYNGPMKEFENQFFLESFENRIPIFTHRINVIHQYIQQGKLLDVGSAIGIFIEALIRTGTQLQILSCEPSKDACKRLKQRFPDIVLFNTWLQNLDCEEQYDAITLWDTIEHIEDIYTFTNTIHSLLKPNGYWFFSTPNTQSFEWQITGKDHVQLLPPGHINLFNKNSIPILLEATGFELIESQTPNGSLDVTYVEKLTQSTDKYNQQLGKYLVENLKDTHFKEGFSKLISNTQNAGNIFVIAKKVSR
jgi:2-polyprenyl-3-methyl-5-hydroxy-6-metoxy-1,4-benzoquinol methylase